MKPYKNSSSKKIQIESMFDDISRKYDKLNEILTFGLHKRWRKLAINLIDNSPEKILDIATGTADFAIAAINLNPKKIIGIDISKQMIEIGKEKIKRNNISNKIDLKVADSENIPFPDNYFDAVTIGFGVRNFENLKLAMTEAYRVLKKNGCIVIMEPSIKNNKVLNVFFRLYFKTIVTNIGYFFSKNFSAYNYLSESVKEFADSNAFLKILSDANFKECSHKTLSFGVIDLYFAKK